MRLTSFDSSFGRSFCFFFSGFRFFPLGPGLGSWEGESFVLFLLRFPFVFVAYYYGTNGLLDTITMEGASVSTNPRTVEEVFKDFKGRRAGMLKALTSGNVGLHVVFVVCCLFAVYYICLF